MDSVVVGSTVFFPSGIPDKYFPVRVKSVYKNEFGVTMVEAAIVDDQGGEACVICQLLEHVKCEAQ